MGSANGKVADQYRVAVLGASGYTGEEVVRLMALHPNFTVAALTGESQAGKVGGPGCSMHAPTRVSPPAVC